MNISNWIDRGMNILAFLLFFTGLAFTLIKLWLEKRGAQKEKLEQIEKAESVLRSLLNSSLFGLVTSAERLWGGKTGELKKSWVVAELWKLLPESMKAVFDADTLGAMVEKGLDAAKKRWAIQPGWLKN
ncbi:MAG: hypothetical protein FWH26_10125 [Oscillospiraceae bacterium]|nr:hypothetical protein [Oscillospiraceae bacterium]